MEEAFAVRVSGPRERPVVTLIGELDLATVPQLVSRLEELQEAGARRVLADCRLLTFCDVAGLTALVQATERLPEGLALRQPPGTLRRIRDLLGLTHRLPDG